MGWNFSMQLDKNTAKWDRRLRIGSGLAMLALGWTWGEVPGISVLRVVALYPLVTGLMGWCPLYALLRKGTRRD